MKEQTAGGLIAALDSLNSIISDVSKENVFRELEESVK